MNKEYNISNKKCYCCNRVLFKASREMHHFPRPKRHDGEMVIPLCMDCHNMADRLKLKTIMEEHTDYELDAISGCTEFAKNFIVSVGMLLKSGEVQEMMDDILPNWFEDYIETFEENEEDMAFKLIEGCSMEAKQFVMRIISLFYDIVEDGVLCDD